MSKHFNHRYGKSGQDTSPLCMTPWVRVMYSEVSWQHFVQLVVTCIALLPSDHMIDCYSYSLFFLFYYYYSNSGTLE